jgi:aspartokinase
MIEMCRAGCPKPATKAVELARATRAAIHVRSTFTSAPGTRIDAATSLTPRHVAFARQEVPVADRGREVAA